MFDSKYTLCFKNLKGFKALYKEWGTDINLNFYVITTIIKNLRPLLKKL